MRNILPATFGIMAMMIVGCRSAPEARYQPGVGGEVRYEDWNGDGSIDLEFHHYRGLADADWELRDDKFNGVYDKLIIYGYTVRTQQVSIPVPLRRGAEPDGAASAGQTNTCYRQ